MSKLRFLLVALLLVGATSPLAASPEDSGTPGASVIEVLQGIWSQIVEALPGGSDDPLETSELGPVGDPNGDEFGAVGDPGG